MTAPYNSAAVTDVAIHSIHRKGYQSKLLVIHSEGGRCNFWGFLHYDYRRSPWWSSRDGPQHDRSRSGTFMISKKFNSCPSLAIFFIIPVLFCFVLNTKLFLIYKKTLETRSVHFCLCLRCNNVNNGAWHVYKPLFGSSVATCRLVCSEISLSINENKQERSPRMVGHGTIWQIAWQLCPTLCFVLWKSTLFQLMTARSFSVNFLVL